MELDPQLNKAPQAIRHIHLMGICGTGVGALAGMLQAAGYQVSGSDQQVYPPMSDFLAGLGIQVSEGYTPENLTPRPDLVIVGNVITRKNPEAVALAEMAIPYLSMPQALGHFFMEDTTSLVVCGTHGKTTTSSLLATMLHKAGLDPGFMIGGIVQAFDSNFRIGQGSCFVTEGDEYDTAFFDKGPKFLHYRPDVAIITSIEFDHADIYSDLEAIKTSFRRLVGIMPREGCIVAHQDDPVVRELCTAAPCEVQGYGFGEQNHWTISQLEVTPGGTHFTVNKAGSFFGCFTSTMPGRHNALNSLAVIAVLHRQGLAASEIATLLEKFQGVRRRQEVRGVVDGVTIIDDFAHHPTAVRETLAALAEAHPKGRLIAVFEPRTNSSRRSVFQQDYIPVFDPAHLIIIKEPTPIESLAPEERFSARQLVADLKSRGKEAQYFADTDHILDHLPQIIRKDDVVAIMSNGGFDNIHSRLLKRLKTAR